MREGGGPSFPVSRERARELNRDGYGIFHVLNGYAPPGRTDPQSIRGVWVEVDRGTKRSQFESLVEGPLLPSAVVESKRGYHSYWFVEEHPYQPELWQRMIRGVCRYYEGDNKATDPLRLLRAPGFNHSKMGEPFPVTLAAFNGGVYRVVQLLNAYSIESPKRPGSSQPRAHDLRTFWGRVDYLDAGEVIVRMNGHSIQNNESFKLVSVSTGSRNIVKINDEGRRLPRERVLQELFPVEHNNGLGNFGGDPGSARPNKQLGVDTGCFARHDGSLGGVQDGPSVKHWFRWYGSSYTAIKEALLEAYPELIDEETFKEAHPEAEGSEPQDSVCGEE